MQKSIIIIFLATSALLSIPAAAQTKLTPKNAVSHTDNCAPIGRTANGELVYSMKCDNIPAPPAPPQARLEEAAPPSPPPQQETQRSGLFGWSYDRRPTDQ
jgi:hypothetical protein